MGKRKYNQQSSLGRCDDSDLYKEDVATGNFFRKGEGNRFRFETCIEHITEPSTSVIIYNTSLRGTGLPPRASPFDQIFNSSKFSCTIIIANTNTKDGDVYDV